jgi:hypothetical protein
VGRADLDYVADDGLHGTGAGGRLLEASVGVQIAALQVRTFSRR